jgi:isopentenyl diphosphate isomerase/L-lactate dehydrogenase-like FMN-dependent dehydrogenase
MARMIERCKVAKCSALVLTLDLQVIGQRHKDLKNKMRASVIPSMGNILNIATKPRWVLGMMGTRRHTFRNLVGHVKGVSDMSSLAAWTNEQFDPTLNWEDVAWVKKQWGGKLILKGIMDVEDAKLAVASGAEAIVVSNHGGRQLDGSRAPFDQLKAIVDEVGGEIEIIVDGGVRRGTHVLKALALGATACSGGRMYLYALAAAGGNGVLRAMSLLRDEMERDMLLMGCRSISELQRSMIAVRR